MEIKDIVNLIIEDFYYHGGPDYDGDSRIILHKENFRLMHYLREADQDKLFSEYVSLVNSNYKLIPDCS